MKSRRLAAVYAAGLAAVMALGACSSPQSSTSSPSASSATPTTVTVQDNRGPKTITTPAKSIVAVDNRTFETLATWGVPLTAAALKIMPGTISYKSDPAIADLGNHREPQLEKLVAAKPDLVIIGQRYAKFYDEIAKLVPQATMLDLDPRPDQPLLEELKRQVTVLGEVFAKKSEAAKLVSDLDAAIARVKAAYKPAQKVMAVNTSGGKIGFIAPGKGRALGPVFAALGLTPALEVANSSSNHEGDEVSVEAIAAANPDWILVMDRSAAIEANKPDFKPAAEIIEATQALAGVTAVKNKQIVYMPADTYLNEGIQTYTEFLNSFADALEAAAKR